MSDDYLRTNRKVYDSMAAAGDPLCRPAKDCELADPLRTVDAAGWLGKSIQGRRLLCLAAGGGRQSSLYAAAGADVTVVDLSGAMLELDRRVAAERGYSLRLFETSMDDLSMFAGGEFDIVIQPVSTCYVPNIARVFAEVARVSRSGALYISQHKQPGSLQSSVEPNSSGGYSNLHPYYRQTKSSSQPNQPIPAPPASTHAVTRSATKRLRESGAVEYLHRWEEIVGGMCRSGFVIEDLTEPLHAKADAEVGSFGHRAKFIPPYVRIKAKRVGATQASTSDGGKIWLPSS
ncbi:bifunctional 3-demethylubiquinone-9 3-methyltransferase/ 2-octaprenyl-6-hydroxy phenol methylase [Rubripirellula reticaptiva]|uniref:Bifunctional 3-demethylubiquinone-9 3-methyltransferase/ 2-octaprenyl-6-hydroxy phenol methylase n=2 Tax=Rubripirellula reticaptiva TaxID=2528013 RepID=A0A5C6F570_9BACT|nr:bifunctional 3-demethylubiquinone-9 3-methyltransferase/ 2-octaprenyl-6-hydroxy phenol methylase [Rubripirellula reticaptiva]